MKDIVIVANFAGGLQGQDNNRFFCLARRLSAVGEVELVTSDFHHGEKRRRTGDHSRFPFRVTLLPEPGYPKNICLRRFYSHWVFGRNVAKYLERRKTPDVIYCAVPSLTAAKAAADYAGRSGVRLILDVQDLWPEAFQMVFDVPVLSDMILAPMARRADGIYARADELVAVSETYCGRALRANRKCGRGHVVYLGTGLADFDAHVRRYQPPQKGPDEFWLAYCGTLGSSYDLRCAMDAAALIEGRNIRLQIMGDGPLRRTFEEYAARKRVNAVFWGRLPYGEMCGLLSACDVALNPITAGSAGSIINKHADYAAAGIPVVSSQESREYRCLVDEYQMGFNCANADPADMAEKLRLLLDDPGLRRRMGENARRCAEERFDRARTYQEIVDLIRG